MTAGLLLALAASAAPHPAPVRAGLVATLNPIEAMGACAEGRPRYEKRYQDRLIAYVELESAAESLFGRSLLLDPPDWRDSGCGERAFARYEAEADAGLAKARQALAAATARMPGLWIGTLRLCRDDVAGAVFDSPAEQSGTPQLSLALQPLLKARLLAETEHRVGWRISVRIDGEDVMAPHIYEPLATGELTLSAPEREDLERVRAAALRACPGAAPTGPSERPPRS